MHFNSRHILHCERLFACVFPGCSFISSGGDRNPDGYGKYTNHIISVHRIRIAGVMPGTKNTRTTKGNPTTLGVQSTDKITKDRITAIKAGQVRLAKQGLTTAPAATLVLASGLGEGKTTKQEPKGKGKGKEVEWSGEGANLYQN